MIFFFKENAFLEELYSIFSHLRLKSWKMYIYKGENKKKKKNEHQNLIKKKKIFFSNDEDAFLELLHSIFSHPQHNKLATVSFYNKK